MKPNEAGVWISRAALMNAIYLRFPEYAAQHNLAEQAGQNDGLSWFLRTQGIDVELTGSPERLISLTAQAGTQYIDFYHKNSDHS